MDDGPFPLRRTVVFATCSGDGAPPRVFRTLDAACRVVGAFPGARVLEYAQFADRDELVATHVHARAHDGGDVAETSLGRVPGSDACWAESASVADAFEFGRYGDVVGVSRRGCASLEGALSVFAIVRDACSGRRGAGPFITACESAARAACWRFAGREGLDHLVEVERSRIERA